MFMLSARMAGLAVVGRAIALYSAAYAGTMQPWEEYLARQRGHDLANLRLHWGNAYTFMWAAGQFHARRRDNGAIVHARTSEGM